VRVAITTAWVLLVVTTGAAQLPPVHPYEVVLCEHVDYVGECRHFEVEPWMRHRLVPTLGDFNDKASSIRVGAKVTVRFFQHADYQGADRTATADVPNLADWKYTSNPALFFKQDDFNDKVSSLIVIRKDHPESGGGLDVGSRINLDGQAEEGFFPLPERASENEARYPTVPSATNDEADCVGLVHGVEADLFEHAGFKGKRIPLPGVKKASGGANPGCHAAGFTFDLSDYGMDEKVSSIIVRAARQQPGKNAQTVILCEHAHYVGACRSFMLGPGKRHVLVPQLGSFNDTASSIIVGAGVTAILFQDAGFSGGQRSVTEDLATLDQGGFSIWNDTVSSLVVARRGAPLEGASLTGHGESTVFPLPESLSDGEAAYATVPSDINDVAEYLTLCGRNVTATLFEHANFAGTPLEVPGLGPPPAPCKQYRLEAFQFDDRVSSLKVRTLALKPLLVAPSPPARGGESGTTEAHRAPPALTPHAATVIEPAISLEPDSNRPGHDYRDFDLHQPRPELCRDACLRDRACAAYTYVKPGIQGPSAHCWLKNAVAPSEHAPCCVSGVKK